MWLINVRFYVEIVGVAIATAITKWINNQILFSTTEIYFLNQFMIAVETATPTICK